MFQERQSFLCYTNQSIKFQREVEKTLIIAELLKNLADNLPQQKSFKWAVFCACNKKVLYNIYCNTHTQPLPDSESDQVYIKGISSVKGAWLIPWQCFGFHWFLKAYSKKYSKKQMLKAIWQIAVITYFYNIFSKFQEAG